MYYTVILIKQILKQKNTISGIFIIVVIFSLGSPAYACVLPMFPIQGFHIMPDNDTNVFVTYEDGIQTFVLETSFHGTATEFGAVLPFPSQPEINEAPEDIFLELRQYIAIQTPPPIHIPSGVGESFGVTIIEEKDVGDFKTTLLTADTTDDLTDWLEENNYTYTEKDRANFDYYVTKGGYFFVTFKVNMEQVTLDEQGNLDGKLKPIEFVFSSPKPMLPIRIMAQDMEEMSFNLYTLGEKPLYIPGVQINFYDQIFSESQVLILERYNPVDKWLLRMLVDFDPLSVKQDLELKELSNAGLLKRPDVSSLVINASFLPYKSGILIGVGETLEDTKKIESPLKQFKNGVPADEVECKMDYILVIKNSNDSPACVKPSTVDALKNRGWAGPNS